MHTAPPLTSHSNEMTLCTAQVTDCLLQEPAAHAAFPVKPSMFTDTCPSTLHGRRLQGGTGTVTIASHGNSDQASKSDTPYGALVNLNGELKWWCQRPLAPPRCLNYMEIHVDLTLNWTLQVESKLDLFCTAVLMLS
jgi:hypothetical protein